MTAKTAEANVLDMACQRVIVRGTALNVQHSCGICSAVNAIGSPRFEFYRTVYRLPFGSRFCARSSAVTVLSTPFSGISALAVHNTAFKNSLRLLGSPQFL